jgi:hypothetical protein
MTGLHKEEIRVVEIVHHKTARIKGRAIALNRTPGHPTHLKTRGQGQAEAEQASLTARMTKGIKSKNVQFLFYFSF